MIRIISLATAAILLSGCSTSENLTFKNTLDYIGLGSLVKPAGPEIITVEPNTSAEPALRAFRYVGLQEVANRQEIKALVGVDPVRTEWCAAFANAVLAESGLPGSESVSDYPLTARSFLRWGVSVDEPYPGDLVIFPRGNSSWQGHVGFYLSTIEINGRKYYNILGGNQSNSVSIENYPASLALDIRRMGT